MDYVVVRTNRKTISLSIGDDLIPVVRVPYFADANEIDRFVNSNQEWISKAIVKKRRHFENYNISDAEVNELNIKAEEYIPLKVKYYSDIMNLHPTGIKITSAKKRFGSCSSRNSLCFSYYLMLYPQQAIDYVVVHELAHIKHHNHSKAFYELIEQYMPDYKQREKLLKQN